ncbi:MAG: hypothetical protein RI955_1725, partial [Bacteroidota bacterium]
AVNNQSGSSFKIYPPFLLVGVVVLLCIVATELPMPSSVFGIELKEVNFFSDFFKSKTKKKYCS